MRVLRAVAVVVLVWVWGCSADPDPTPSAEQASVSAATAPLPPQRAMNASPASPSSSNDSSLRETSARYEYFRSGVAEHLNRKGADLKPRTPRIDVDVVPLRGRFGHAVVARKRANGHVEIGCFSDADESARFLTDRTGSEPSK
ncbi:MAG TPA: hypothetical protein VIV60_15730 [Polyangiaceae bacterium]